VKAKVIYKLTHTRAIPFYKFGKRVIFYTKELDEWIKQNAIRGKTRKVIEREASEYIMRGARKKLNRG
jgi:excisionase family DNA binding protein